MHSTEPGPLRPVPPELMVELALQCDAEIEVAFHNARRLVIVTRYLVRHRKGMPNKINLNGGIYHEVQTHGSSTHFDYRRVS